MALCVGFDTSNYTTSAAWWDGREGRNESRILDVPQGALGLRQATPFLHVRRLPEVVARLLTDRDDLHQAKVVAASSRPRAAEDSYMPCFLAGVCEAKTLASALGAEYMEFSHQQGHLAAAAWSAGREDLLDQPFLAWHLSGGTTELLLVQPKNGCLMRKKIGGTTDISAGQLLDRTGVLLGLPFPAGKYVDELYYRADSTSSFRVKVNELYFSLSGVENKVKSLRKWEKQKRTLPALRWILWLGQSIGSRMLLKKCILDCRCSVPVVWRRILCSALYCRMRCLHYRVFAGQCDGHCRFGVPRLGKPGGAAMSGSEKHIFLGWLRSISSSKPCWTACRLCRTFMCAASCPIIKFTLPGITILH